MAALPVACFDLTPFSSGSRYRGIGMYAYELARALSAAPASLKEGLDLRLLLGRNGAMRVTERSPAAFERLHDGEPQGTFAYQLSKLTFGRFALMRDGVSLYHAADPMGTPHLGIPRVVVTCHDIIPTLLAGSYLGGRPRWLHRFGDFLRYRRPDHVIAISHATRDDVCRVLGLSPERFTVIHHGVNHHLYRPTSRAGERAAITRLLGTDRPYLLYVGAFDARKRVIDLVEAFARIAAQVDEDVVISGLLPPQKEAMLRRAAAWGRVSDRVRFVGYVPRELMPALYRAATAHVLPSVYEGFGLTLLEAMACGCPVVACPVSAMPEVCGPAAAWSRPDDVDSLAEVLTSLCRDAAQRARLRAQGVAWAARFTWERTAEETLRVYRAVLAT